MPQPPRQVDATSDEDACRTSSIDPLAPIAPHPPPSEVAHYHIDSEIGRGAMGVVYLAQDTKLNRKVAVKSLPPGAWGGERLARFEREVMLLASLTHPNIAAVYDLVRADHGPCLVMEYVDGPTLGEHLSRGRCSVEETARMAAQIAEAIEAAHDKGVIHRDLKPANIKLTSRGHVKVLDFGLARSLDRVAANEGATQAGAVLGTPGYMAPEQAAGEPADARSDVWALGCILFEMLTGQRPFLRRNIGESIAATLKEEPEWERLPAEAASLKRVLRRCLARDKRRRYHAMADVRIELEEFLRQPEERSGSPAPPPRDLHLSIALPPGLTVPVYVARPLAFTPDGMSLVITAEQTRRECALYQRDLDDREVRPIPGADPAGDPFISPDGKWLGFMGWLEGDRRPHCIPIDGGERVQICSARTVAGPVWGHDGSVFLVDMNVYDIRETAPIVRVPHVGAPAERVTNPPGDAGDRYHAFPEPLPDGRTLLYVSYAHARYQREESRLWAHDLASGKRKLLLEDVAFARYAPPGYLFFGRGQNLLAVRFDLRELRITGSPRVVLEGLQRSHSGGLGFAFSATGNLAYVQGTPFFEQRRALVWAEGDCGQTCAQSRLGCEAAMFTPRVSPDGKRIAVTRTDNGWDVWIVDAEREALTRLTYGGMDSDPVWTPDGRRIVYASQPAQAEERGIYIASADGGENPELLLASESKVFPTAVSPDGRTVAFTRQKGDGSPSIWLLPLDGDRRPVAFLDRQFNDFGARFSPDGQWIAYVSDESGQNEVYVRSVESGRKLQVSTAGGVSPVWSPDGRAMYYRHGRSLMVVDLPSEMRGSPSPPREVLAGDFEEFGDMYNFCNYDISPDGRRFLMIRNEDAGRGATRVDVVLNWFSEVERMLR